MGMYSSGDITYQSRLYGMEWVSEGERDLFDRNTGLRAPDLKERWEANGLEWDGDLFGEQH